MHGCLGVREGKCVIDSTHYSLFKYFVRAVGRKIGVGGCERGNGVKVV